MFEDVTRYKEIYESRTKARRRVLKAYLAFLDALVQNYEILIPTLSLPDHKDRHVLVAAI